MILMKTQGPSSQFQANPMLSRHNRPGNFNFAGPVNGYDAVNSAKNIFSIVGSNFPVRNKLMKFIDEF